MFEVGGTWKFNDEASVAFRCNRAFAYSEALGNSSFEVILNLVLETREILSLFRGDGRGVNFHGEADTARYVQTFFKGLADVTEDGSCRQSDDENEKPDVSRLQVEYLWPEGQGRIIPMELSSIRGITGS